MSHGLDPPSQATCTPRNASESHLVREACMFHLLWVIIIGAIIGVVAKLLMPGRDPGGFIITILLGIADPFVDAFIGREVGLYSDCHTTGFINTVCLVNHTLV